MTGRYNYRTGVVDTYLGRALMYPDETTIAEILGKAGYRTGIFGKWHLGDNYPLRAIDQGFQEALVCTGGGIGQPSDPEGNSYFNPILQHNGKAERRDGYCTDIFTDAAIRFIEQNRDRPFFVYLATNAPHAPLEIDDAHVAPYRAMGLDETTARIYGMVTDIDENVGKLLAKLNALDLEKNTIVLFMTDNGPQQPRFNAQLRGLKGSVYEGGIRVPCFVRWPAAFKPGAVDPIAAHIDIAPTLLQACGVNKPARVSFDGRSLLQLLRGESSGWPDRTLYFQWHRGDQPELYRNCAARSQLFKLVDGKELYDMTADPGEQHNIAATHPDRVSEMRKGYEKWFADVSATRGYDPPRILLGTPHENPVTLTRQDWRGPQASWSPDSLGYWELEVARKGIYDITLHLWPDSTAREVHFKLSEVALRRSVEPAALSCQFHSVPLNPGKGRLEASVVSTGKTVGVKYVQVMQKEPMTK
jgi:arylsulfatase A-like enzyme